jgi:C4-dicarboxylate transporter DctM subunit
MAIFGLMMGVFFITIFLGIPIAVSIGLSTIVGLVSSGVSLTLLAKLSFSSMDSFTWLAIPLFILAGYAMEIGGLSKRIVNLSSTLIGRIPGGLGIITILACMFFAAISGSSPATVAAIGSMMIPDMTRRGYDVNVAGALTSCAGSIGIMIPPSIPMIVYCVTSETSIGAMFMAGFIPGVLIGIGLMIVIFIIAKKRGFDKGGEPFNGRKALAALREAVWALLAPVIILGGIYAGIFTATEAAVVAVIYALLVGLFIYKEIKINKIFDILVNAAVTTGSAIIILGFAAAFARYLTLARIPDQIGRLILSFTNDKTVILILFSCMILITGMFVETNAQILIYTPLFLPILVKLGVSPLHFGIILIIGTEIALVTPPVGVNLFVAQGITGTTIIELAKHILPFLLSMFIVQLFLVFFPDIILFLPRLAGFSP